MWHAGLCLCQSVSVLMADYQKSRPATERPAIWKQYRRTAGGSCRIGWTSARVGASMRNGHASLPLIKRGCSSHQENR